MLLKVSADALGEKLWHLATGAGRRVAKYIFYELFPLRNLMYKVLFLRIYRIFGFSCSGSPLAPTRLMALRLLLLFLPVCLAARSCVIFVARLP